MAHITPSDALPGVLIVEPDVHQDARGLFIETFRRSWVPGGREMVQSNRADRRAGSLVGLHFHHHQADYWYVPFGRARVVLHDLRTSEPGPDATLTLDLGGGPGDEHDHRGVYIPPGVAHGFAALTDMTITYLVDGYYDADDERGVAWDDPAIGADWGVDEPVLSGRDRANPRRGDLDLGDAPWWRK